MSVHSFDWTGGGTPVQAALYLMTKPDERAARRFHAEATRLRTRHRLAGRPTDADRLHVTLAPLDLETSSQAQAAAIGAAMSTVRLMPFRAMFDRVVSFRGGERRPLVACGDDGAAGLHRLGEAVAAALDRAGVAHGAKAFTPHLTLLRDGQAVPETFIDPIAWTVEEVQLVFSLVEARRHVVLQRWRLQG